MSKRNSKFISHFEIDMSCLHLFWYRKTNTYSKFLSYNSPAMSIIPHEERTNLQPRSECFLLENGKKHLAVLLAKGKLNTLQQFSKRLEDFLESGATTDDILNSLTHLNGYNAGDNAEDFSEVSEDDVVNLEALQSRKLNRKFSSSSKSRGSLTNDDDEDVVAQTKRPRLSLINSSNVMEAAKLQVARDAFNSSLNSEPGGHTTQTHYRTNIEKSWREWASIPLGMPSNPEWTLGQAWETSIKLQKALLKEMQITNKLLQKKSQNDEFVENGQFDSEIKIHRSDKVFYLHDITVRYPHSFGKQFLKMKYGTDYLKDKLVELKGPTSKRQLLPREAVDELKDAIFGRFPNANWEQVAQSINQYLRDISKPPKIANQDM